VIWKLKEIISWRFKPEVICCDSGPTYISGAIQAWEQDLGIRLEYIQPGKTLQNNYV
jgi:putative transposase